MKITQSVETREAAVSVDVANLAIQIKSMFQTLVPQRGKVIQLNGIKLEPDADNPADKDICNRLDRWETVLELRQATLAGITDKDSDDFKLASTDVANAIKSINQLKKLAFGLEYANKKRYVKPGSLLARMVSAVEACNDDPAWSNGAVLAVVAIDEDTQCVALKRYVPKTGGKRYKATELAISIAATDSILDDAERKLNEPLNTESSAKTESSDLLE